MSSKMAPMISGIIRVKLMVKLRESINFDLRVVIVMTWICFVANKQLTHFRPIADE